MELPDSPHERIVIIGGGFGGLQLAKSLKNTPYQIVLLDRHNFHQFQPLFYQVATSGLEPSSIVFPFRKIFQKYKRFHFRLAQVRNIDTENKVIQTNVGELKYDHCVIATGAGNNFFGNENIQRFAQPMKSINQSLRLRNLILERFEESLNYCGLEQQKRLSIVIAGGGPTGVELAGTLAEMKKFVLPKDYPELDFDQMKIILVEGSTRVLSAMSEESSKKANQYLRELGVELKVETRVNDYDGEDVFLNNGEQIPTKTMIWAAGIKGNFIEGLPEDTRSRGNRIAVNEFCEVKDRKDVYAIGDVAWMTADKNYPNGHPQLAQVALQQGKLVSRNFIRAIKNLSPEPFKYKNLGTMATVGRNKAVVELPNRKFFGFFAWVVWMFVHLRSILGVKNKFVVFLNWVWNYWTYNLSLRLIIKRNDDFYETKRNESVVDVVEE